MRQISHLAAADGMFIMRKIMLVIDDIQGLVSLENLLRRLGFDVLSLGKDLLVGDALMRFQPDIAIATLKGRSVDGLKAAARIKKQVPTCKIALSYPSGDQPIVTEEIRDLVDGMIASPIQSARAIRMVAKFAGLDSTSLIEKLEKLTRQKEVEESIHVTGEYRPETKQENKSSDRPATEPPRAENAKPVPGVWDPEKTPGKSAELRSARSDRYDAYLMAHDEFPAAQCLPREKAQAAMKDLKKAAEKEKALIDQINEEKKAFVKTMFTEKKKRGGR